MNNCDIITLIRTDTYEVYRFQSISTFQSNNTSNITTYPTTEGTPKTDNIYTNPSTFTVNISIGGSENISDEWGIGADRPRNAFSLLKQWREEAVRFTISTPQGDYLNMFLTTIMPTGTSLNAYDFNASLTFSELFISKFETVVVGPFNSGITMANDSSTQDNGTTFGDVIDGVAETLGGTAVGAIAGGTVFGPIGAVVGGILGFFVNGAKALFGGD